MRGFERARRVSGCARIRLTLLTILAVLTGGWRSCSASGVGGWHDAVVDKGGAIRPFLPNVYVAGTVTKGKLTYGGGAEWAVENWWGLGMEYRQGQVRYARGRKRGTAHALGGRAYAETPWFGRWRLRTEAGGAVILGQASDIRVDIGWAASARVGARWRLTERISALGWAGVIQTGRVDTDIGYYPAATMPDYGLGVWVGW